MLKSESFLPGNGAIDAGETASVDFTLRNTGTAGTTNLVATLVSSGGVLNPSGPQTYGAIPAGGSATRTFSFRADPSIGLWRNTNRDASHPGRLDRSGDRRVSHSAGWKPDHDVIGEFRRSQPAGSSRGLGCFEDGASPHFG